MTCGELIALSVKVTVPVNVPAAVGLKPMVTAQLEPTDNEAPQTFVTIENEVALVPPKAILLIARATLPVFLRVTDCAVAETPTAVAGNVIVVALKEATGSTPVPVRVMACGAPEALSAIETAPVNIPVAAGLKVTVMEHDAAAAKLVPQVLTSEKDDLAVPVMVIPEMDSVPVPVFLSVTD